MRNLDNELLNYGFQKENETYIYKTKIYNRQFKMIVTVNEEKMTSKLFDLANEDEYILVDIQSSTGKFVGNIREEYENKLQDIRIFMAKVS